MVYTAEAAALAVLEVRVHLDLSWDLLPADFVLMAIETGAEDVEDVPSAADEIADGDAWLESLRSPMKRVRSAIVPESCNVLINPRHPVSASFAVVSIRSFVFDARLWLPKT